MVGKVLFYVDGAFYARLKEAAAGMLQGVS
jgi:hypothetical protein